MKRPIWKHREEANEFKRSLNEEINYQKLSINSQTYGTLEEFIDQEIHQQEADVLVMRERKHGLLYDMFHEDRVKTMMKHAEIPLLVYNDTCIA